MQIGIAADHGGFDLKEKILKRLLASGHKVVDFGAKELCDQDDYPDYVLPLAKAVTSGDVQRGIAICGSGIGACVVANKVAENHQREHCANYHADNIETEHHSPFLPAPPET